MKKFLFFWKIEIIRPNISKYCWNKSSGYHIVRRYKVKPEMLLKILLLEIYQFLFIFSIINNSFDSFLLILSFVLRIRWQSFKECSLHVHQHRNTSQIPLSDKFETNSLAKSWCCFYLNDLIRRGVKFNLKHGLNALEILSQQHVHLAFKLLSFISQINI